jgi:hypothetical protein
MKSMKTYYFNVVILFYSINVYVEMRVAFKRFKKKGLKVRNVTTKRKIGFCQKDVSKCLFFDTKYLNTAL